MKTNANNQSRNDLTELNRLSGLNGHEAPAIRRMKQLQTQSFTAKCVNSCRKLVAQLQRAKAVIEAEFRDTFGVPKPMLHLALNEAEAFLLKLDRAR